MGRLSFSCVSCYRGALAGEIKISHLQTFLKLSAPTSGDAMQPIGFLLNFVIVVFLL